jgi:RNA polymerase sigma factor (sigma-70 family)
MLQGLSDEQLVVQITQKQRANENVEEEFTELYQRYHTYVSRIVRSIVPRASLSDEVEDLAQEVFRKLFEGGLRQFEGRQGAPFRSFLRTVTQRAALDKLRASRRQEQTAQRAAEEARITGRNPSAAPGVGEERERQRLIMQVLADLAGTEFLNVVIIVLSVWGELTDRQIGSLFDMTDEAIRKRRTRTYDTLQALLKQQNLAPDDVP